MEIGKRLPLPEKLKYGFEYPDDVFEVEYIGVHFDKHRFSEYKNGEKIRGLLTLDDGQMRVFFPDE